MAPLGWTEFPISQVDALRLMPTLLLTVWAGCRSGDHPAFGCHPAVRPVLVVKPEVFLQAPFGVIHAVVGV